MAKGIYVEHQGISAPKKNNVTESGGGAAGKADRGQSGPKGQGIAKGRLFADSEPRRNIGVGAIEKKKGALRRKND